MTTRAGSTYIALLHFPVYDRNRQVVATAITNLDIHDLARSARTFGLRAYYLVTPIERQRALAQRIVNHWGDEEGARAQALQTVRIAATLDEVVAAVTEESGRPTVVGTAARRREQAETVSYAALRRQTEEKKGPFLVLFGTGWGLSDEVIERCDQVLAPIPGADEYNHLSVRSAAAIILDRLFGERLTES
ncbi:MAG TPA: RNA methyltransferase [Polyangia bacterium]|nr:RNA methyltransferase [Polyangia bacterium]